MKLRFVLNILNIDLATPGKLHRACATAAEVGSFSTQPGCCSSQQIPISRWMCSLGSDSWDIDCRRLGIFGSISVAQSAVDDWSRQGTAVFFLLPPAIFVGNQTWQWTIPNLVRRFSSSTKFLGSSQPRSIAGGSSKQGPVEAGAASKVAVPGADGLQQAAGLIQQVVEEIEWIDCCSVTNGPREGGSKVAPRSGPEIRDLLSLWHGLRWWPTGENGDNVLTFGALSSGKPTSCPENKHIWRCPTMSSKRRAWWFYIQVWVFFDARGSTGQHGLVEMCLRLPWPGHATSASGASAGDGIIQLVVQFHRGPTASGKAADSAGAFRHGGLHGGLLRAFLVS